MTGNFDGSFEGAIINIMINITDIMYGLHNLIKQIIIFLSFIWKRKLVKLGLI